MFSLDRWLVGPDGSGDEFPASDSGAGADAGEGNTRVGGNSTWYRLGWFHSRTDSRTQAPLEQGFDLDVWLVEGLGDPPAFLLRDDAERTRRRDGLLRRRAASLALAVLLVGAAMFAMGIGGPGLPGSGPDRARAAGPSTDTPTPTPTPSPTASATPTPTGTTPSPTRTATPSPTPSPSSTPTATPSPTPTASASPTPTPSPTPPDDDSSGVGDAVGDAVDDIIGDAIDTAIATLGL